MASDSVSGLFWKRFCEQMDILFIYSENEIDGKKKPELLEISEELKDKINEYLQWNVVDEMKIDMNIVKLFEVLYFKSCKLTEIDIIARDFEKLKVLDLSNNNISTIENTPPNLEELYLNSNLISHVRGPVNKNLLHLGLAFNKIDVYHLTDIYMYYPNLFSLNLSHNLLVDIEEAVEVLKKFSCLKVLVMRGNPLVLIDGYKQYCMAHLQNLRLFDLTPIPKDDAKKKKAMKSEKMSLMANDTFSTDVPIDLTISVLGGVKGVQLTEENCDEIENFEELDPSYKSSKFWIETDFLGETIRSESKQWGTEFQKQEDTGKTDFKIKMRKVISLMNNSAQDYDENTKVVDFSFEIFDALMNGLWIELFEEYPLLQEFKNDDGEKVQKVAMRDGLPYLKRAIRGIIKVETSQWIMNPDFASEMRKTHKNSSAIKCKHYFHKLKYKTVPEFCIENSMTKFKQSEIEAVEAYVKDKRERLAKEAAEAKEKAVAEKANEKKDPKKDKGAKKPDDKNAPVVDINDPEDIPFTKDYILIERSYKQEVKKNDLGEFEVPGKSETVKNRKQHEDSKKEITQEEKLRRKQKSVFKNYDVVLSQDFWLTVGLAINLPEKVNEDAPEAQEPEPPSKQAGKGKKK